MDIFGLFEQEITLARRERGLPPYLLLPLYSIARNKNRYQHQSNQIVKLRHMIHCYGARQPKTDDQSRQKEILHLLQHIL